MLYQKPIMDIIECPNTDVICKSGDIYNGNDGNDYNAGGNWGV